MHERWKRLPDEETRITSENVQELGEVIGLVEISTVMDKGGQNLYRLYNGLYLMEITRFMNVDHTTVRRRMQNVGKSICLQQEPIDYRFSFSIQFECAVLPGQRNRQIDALIPTLTCSGLEECVRKGFNKEYEQQVCSLLFKHDSRPQRSPLRRAAFR